jgi:MerR family mercuric resistance operon transcriptional regulator
MDAMTIGRLARAAGTHVETIRYYQRCGLMPVPVRARGTVRRYSEEAIARLRFIRRARDLGFSLADVKLLLRLERRPGCHDARSLAAQKLATVEERIADLDRIRRSLRALVAQCDAGAGRDCPIISAFAAPGGD